MLVTAKYKMLCFFEFWRVVDLLVNGRAFKTLHWRRRNLFRRQLEAMLWAVLRTLIFSTTSIVGCAAFPS